NLAVELPLLWTPLGEAGMAAGTCVSFILQAVVMLYMLDRRVGGLGLAEIVRPVLKMLAATAAMGLACWAVMHTPAYPRGDGWMIWAAQLLVLMTVGAGVYLGVGLGLGLDVVRHMLLIRQ